MNFFDSCFFSELTTLINFKYFLNICISTISILSFIKKCNLNFIFSHAHKVIARNECYVLFMPLRAPLKLKKKDIFMFVWEILDVFVCLFFLF